MTTDTAPIQDLLRRLTETWNDGDATGYAGLFTEDADYISWMGTRDTGRTAIEDSHRFLFNGPLKGVKLTIGEGFAPTIRHLTPDVALVIIEGGRQEHAPVTSVITLTAVRRDGRWRFASFQNTRKTAPPA